MIIRPANFLVETTAISATSALGSSIEEEVEKNDLGHRWARTRLMDRPPQRTSMNTREWIIRQLAGAELATGRITKR